MPADGYTTVTLSDETAEKLTELAVKHTLDSVADAVEYAADGARGPETLSNAELARLLAERLSN